MYIDWIRGGKYWWWGTSRETETAFGKRAQKKSAREVTGEKDQTPCHLPSFPSFLFSSLYNLPGGFHPYTKFHSHKYGYTMVAFTSSILLCAFRPSIILFLPLLALFCIDYYLLFLPCLCQLEVTHSFSTLLVVTLKITTCLLELASSNFM